MTAALAFLLWAAPAAAQRVAPVAFVPAYLGSVSRSLAADPFYASRLLGAFHSELALTAKAPTPLAAAEGLKGRIAGPEGLSLPRVAAGLGASPIAPERAAAVLAANALARPDQFAEVVTGLEELKPGLGERVALALRETPTGGSYEVLARLREVGRRVKPAPGDVIYDAAGVLRRLFDGR